MGRACTVCLSIHRREIDEQIVAGGSNRSVAKQFGVSEAAIQRHKAHIPPALVAAREVDIVDFADDLLANIRSIARDLDEVIERTKRDGDLRTTVLADREKLRTLLVLVEMERQKALAAPVDVLSTPQWCENRQRIVEALRPYPEARLRVADMLAGYEGGSDVA